MNIEMTVNQKQYIFQILYYIVFACLAGTWGIISANKFLKIISDNDPDAKRMSLLSIGFCTVFDSYCCISQIYVALVQSVPFYL
jgi:hypothetical protein